MKQKLVRRVAIIGVLILLLSLCSSSFAASEISSGGYYQAEVVVNSLMVNQNYSNAFQLAVDSWNALTRTTGRSISHSPVVYSLNVVETMSYTDSFYGLYSPETWNNNSYHRVTSFKIQINTRMIPDNDRFKQSVIAHEFGHAFALADLSNDSSTLMGHLRDRYVIYSPTADDKNGAKDYWENY